MTRVLGESRDDEEWAQTTHFVEVVHETGVLTFSTYDNHASMIGAHQTYYCRVVSNEPFTAGSEANLAKWTAEWRELVATSKSPYDASIY